MVACVTEATARPGAECFDRPLPRKFSGLAGRTSLLHHFPALRTGLLSLGPPSFASPPLRYGAAFVLRARRSSKSEGGLRATADKPGRVFSAYS
jgi:hypothetical protein